jgi:hypothetical protein
MGDKIKGLAMLALVGVGAWQGYRRFYGGNETHQFTFSVQGPMGCTVVLDHGIGDAQRTESEHLPWDGPTSESHGNPTVLLRAQAPLSCGLQPEQLRCVVTRDGAPWRSVAASRTTNPNSGDPSGVRCEVERDANLPAE